MLRSLDIDDGEIYFTNVAKCRPAGNKIRPEHVESCAPILQRELKPYADAGVPIFALGRVAQSILMGTDRSFRGAWAHGGRVYGTWHPSYILRSPERVYELQYDLEKVKHRGPVKVDPVEHEVISTPERLREWAYGLDLEPGDDGEKPLLCVDLETDQLNWWKDKIICIGIAWSPAQAVVIADNMVYEPATQEVMTYLFDNYTIMGHNFKFDMKFMYYQLGIKNVRCDHDSLIADYTINENRNHGLKPLLQIYFDIYDYEIRLVKRYLSSRNDLYSKVPRASMYEYCSLDVAYNYLLWGTLKRILIENGQYERPYLFPMMAAHEPLFEAEMHGIDLNVEAREELSLRLRRHLDDLYQQMVTLCGHEFNPNSWVQVSKIMYDHYRMPIVQARGTKPRSTAEGARLLIREKLDPDSESYKWLDLYTHWKLAEKMRSSYIDNLEDLISPMHRVHPDFLLYGTEVGRLSARNPAIQTIPRTVSEDVDAGGENWGGHIRSMFWGTPGYSIMEVDYSQAELRVAACLSGDEFLLRVYSQGRDLHSEAAIAMYGENYTKFQRIVCKKFNFAYVYGGTEHSFARDAGIPIETAREFVRKYRELMVGLTKYKDDTLNEMRTRGYVESPLGRRRRFALVNNQNYDEVRKSAPHAPIAGTASDMTLVTLIRSYHKMKELGYDEVKVLAHVHDSVLLKVPDHQVREVGKIVKDIMMGVGVEWFPQVGWIVDVEAGPDWGHIKDVDV